MRISDWSSDVCSSDLLEPLPLIFCFWHIYLDAHHDRRPLKNAPAFYFILGSVVLEQVGAGILGFTMTFALTNVWSHGTWVTPAHAHLALFDTFGMLGLAAAYYAVPLMRGLKIGGKGGANTGRLRW